MEAVVCLTCALFAAVGVAPWVGEGSAASGRVLQAWLERLRHRVLRALDLLAGTNAVRALLAQEQVRSAIRELLSHPRLEGLGLDEVHMGAAVLVTTCAACMLGALFARSAMGAVVVLVAIVAFMAQRDVSRQRRQAQDLAAQMPSVFRTLATAVASGHTLVQALDYVGLHEGAPAGPAFMRASLRLRSGMSVDEALGALSAELDAPGVALMATALAISQRTGSPLQALFSRMAQLVEQQGDFERLLSVRTAQVRMSIRVVCLLPPIMVCLLACMSPDYREGICTPAGWTCLLVATCMDGLALLVIQRIMKGVL